MNDNTTDSLITQQPASERDELFRYADTAHPLIAALYQLALQPQNGDGEN